MEKVETNLELPKDLLGVVTNTNYPIEFRNKSIMDAFDAGIITELVKTQAIEALQASIKAEVMANPPAMTIVNKEEKQAGKSKAEQDTFVNKLEKAKRQKDHEWQVKNVKLTNVVDAPKDMKFDDKKKANVQAVAKSVTLKDYRKTFDLVRDFAGNVLDWIYEGRWEDAEEGQYEGMSFEEAVEDAGSMLEFPFEEYITDFKCEAVADGKIKATATLKDGGEVELEANVDGNGGILYGYMGDNLPTIYFGSQYQGEDFDTLFNEVTNGVGDYPFNNGDGGINANRKANNKLNVQAEPDEGDINEIAEKVGEGFTNGLTGNGVKWSLETSDTEDEHGFFDSAYIGEEDEWINEEISRQIFDGMTSGLISRAEGSDISWKLRIGAEAGFGKFLGGVAKGIGKGIGSVARGIGKTIKDVGVGFAQGLGQGLSPQKTEQIDVQKGQDSLEKRYTKSQNDQRAKEIDEADRKEFQKLLGEKKLPRKFVISNDYVQWVEEGKPTVDKPATKKTTTPKTTTTKKAPTTKKPTTTKAPVAQQPATQAAGIKGENMNRFSKKAGAIDDIKEDAQSYVDSGYDSFENALNDFCDTKMIYDSDILALAEELGVDLLTEEKKQEIYEALYEEAYPIFERVFGGEQEEGE